MHHHPPTPAPSFSEKKSHSSKMIQTDPVRFFVKEPILPPQPPLVVLDNLPLLSGRPISSFLLQFEDRAQFHTGLSKQQRNSLWDLLGEAKDKLEIIGKTPVKFSGDLSGFSVECQFLMTLMILRRGITFLQVQMDYRLNKNLVSQVFKTWLQFMYMKFRDFRDQMFVRRKDIPKPLPAVFRNKLLKNTRIVIDCTEFNLESSTNYKQHNNTYSLYKTHTTSKALIGVLPSGAAAFVSYCYEGCMSDRETVIKSEFCSYLEPGDVVLADRGFIIDDLVRETGASLVIPPFLLGREAFTLEETARTKIISKARIHVERYNQRLKLWKFLDPPIKQVYLPLVSQAVYVCCMLANLSPILVE
jgi:hypothetical protein